MTDVSVVWSSALNISVNMTSPWWYFFGSVFLELFMITLKFK